MNKITDNYLGEYNSWSDVFEYWSKNVPLQFKYAGKASELFKAMYNMFDAWVEENYNLNPRFTVKSDRKTAESDSYDRATISK